MTDRLVQKRRAGVLSRNQTPAERVLWARLRLRNMAGVRFLRQHVIGDYIIDFYAPSLRLAIELDGGQHYDPDKVRYDERRTARLTVQDVAVLRYTNLDVSQRLEDVLSDIERVVSRLKDHPPAAPPMPAPPPPASAPSARQTR
jgi:very-short-patch-repair endonuclease